jgi:protein-S-isoprenylcysteine O-methyltransferase Ste14
MIPEKKAWWTGPRGEWYVVIQFALFALVVFGPKRVGAMPAWSAPWSTIGVVLGLLLGLLGGLLALVGVVSLGRNLTAVPHPKDDAHLVQTGAYRFVRHPIYSGIILGAFGWAFLVNGTLTFLYAFILFLFFDIKSRREEQWLRQKYPGYETYQKQVKKLIPFLY